MRRLAERAGPGDVVLTLGAGDVTRLGPQLLERLDLLAGRAPDDPVTGVVGSAGAGGRRG